MKRQLGRIEGGTFHFKWQVREILFRDDIQKFVKMTVILSL